MKPIPSPAFIMLSLVLVGFLASAPKSAAQSFGTKIVASENVSLNIITTTANDEILTGTEVKDITYYQVPGRTFQLGTVSYTYADASGNSTATRYAYHDKM